MRSMHSAKVTAEPSLRSLPCWPTTRVIRLEVFEKRTCLQVREQLCCLGLDVLGIAERISLLRNAYRSGLPGPVIHVLKQVMMDSAIVGEIKLTFRQRFGRSRAGDFGFESVQFVLATQTEPVYEN